MVPPVQTVAQMDNLEIQSIMSALIATPVVSHASEQQLHALHALILLFSTIDNVSLHVHQDFTTKVTIVLLVSPHVTLAHQQVPVLAVVTIICLMELVFLPVLLDFIKIKLP